MGFITCAMGFGAVVLRNILNGPLLSFALGIGLSFLRPGIRLPGRLSQIVTFYILFCIGLKGGGPLAEHFQSSALIFFLLLSSLILCGFLQPVIAFFLLKKTTRLDIKTMAAISASFGSVSVITFAIGLSFVERLQLGYQQFLIPALAVMEVPAIISGIFLAKVFDDSSKKKYAHVLHLLRESIFNKSIFLIFAGLMTGILFYVYDRIHISHQMLGPFVPLLCVFLFDMGLLVGSQRKHFHLFNRAIILFGIYMPLIGGALGLFLSYLFGFDVGSSTLMAVLTASASYIAVPAAIRVALPGAKEAIYLPLALGIAFPFNVIVGIPLFYYLATQIS
jgi:hypothetical protein